MSLEFQPGQIVSLDHSDKNLLAEVIQVVVARQLCWLRPLLLANCTQETPLIIDLRDASHLLCPLNLVRPALDTEVITFLSQILAKEPKSQLDSTAQRQYYQFIQQLCPGYHPTPTNS
ncbi:hypothetical protein [Anabaenopsis elenkinii]|jgi:hypothetical protein|uniref:Uncharacterized protein n=1 Tax=Anabaenopsis elenkinii CCIBt3563 TaxID=2779889 RepID=A0A7S6U6R6_9CYAN|nr:hypothetical protein [Anabaenopsis elenkinii]QOV24269.1 hypothetical protein IM676_08535 [Anabaenopsis elenkinii CCIBt3563]